TGPTVVVTEAHLNVVNWYTYGYSCTAGTASLYGLGAAYDASTRWATQPALGTTTPVSKTFAHNHNAGSTCPPATESPAATAPTQTSTAVTDAHREAVSYWSRIGTGPNVEGSHDIDSDWLTSPSWTVPPGALRDGIYRWHVYTSDGVNYGYLTTPGPTQQSE